MAGWPTFVSCGRGGRGGPARRDIRLEVDAASMASHSGCRPRRAISVAMRAHGPGGRHRRHLLMTLQGSDSFPRLLHPPALALVAPERETFSVPVSRAQRPSIPTCVTDSARHERAGGGEQPLPQPLLLLRGAAVGCTRLLPCQAIRPTMSRHCRRPTAILSVRP